MRKSHVAMSCLVFVVLSAVAAVGASAQDDTSNLQSDTSKCGGSVIANGPFSYSALSQNSTTFNGTGGTAVSTSFTIYAPNASGSTVVFPGQGQNPCVGQADASISALEVDQVGDASGNPITPVDITSTALGAQIASAFSLSPSTYTFTPGSSVQVSVTVTNPNVASTAYGVYEVKLAAQAPGAGIGVGPGPEFTLSLFNPPVGDTVPPNVTIVAPSGNLLLGVIPVQVTANDPTPGTGVASISATVSSDGGKVSNVSVCSQSYSGNTAGTAVTCNGSFTPFAGGVGDPTGPFTTNPSGIGNYTIHAQATDNADNTGYASGSFSVNYTIAFTIHTTNPCQTGGNSSCAGQIKFTVNRGTSIQDGASDGAFMNDQTVVVKLCKSTDSTCATPVSSHTYGTGSVNSEVQIDATPEYLTNFKRGDIGAGGPGNYFVQVWFTNVDGNPMLQATSSTFTF